MDRQPSTADHAEPALVRGDLAQEAARAAFDLCRWRDAPSGLDRIASV